MSMTLPELRTQLQAIEPGEDTYAGIGTAEVPLLEQLLKEDAGWISARAVFALSRVADARSITALTRAAGDARLEVRVAVAASSERLKPADKVQLLQHLLGDNEPGVRKFALNATAAVPESLLHDRLKEIQDNDSTPSLRDLARQKLQAISPR